MPLSDQELTQLQETGIVTVGGSAGGETVRLGDITDACATLGVDPGAVTLWSNDLIVVEIEDGENDAVQGG